MMSHGRRTIEPGDRLVVSVEAQVGVRRDPDHEAAVDVGRRGRQRTHQPALLHESVNRPAAQRLVRAGGSLEPGVELELEVELVGEAPARLEVRLQVAPQALDDALGLGVGRLAEVPVELQLAAEGGVGVGRAAVARVQAPSRSQTASSGSAPSDHRQRVIPNSRSGACFENTSAPAPARE
jgi:hypothetical protein